MKKISILIMPALMAGMAFTSCSDYSGEGIKKKSVESL